MIGTEFYSTFWKGYQIRQISEKGWKVHFLKCDKNKNVDIGFNQNTMLIKPHLQKLKWN